MGRPRSINPTLVLSIRVTKAFREEVDKLAQEKGTKRNSLLAAWIVAGYNRERESPNVD